MRSIPFILVFSISSLLCRGQGNKGDMFLSFEFQGGRYSGVGYNQGMIYLDYYLIDKWKFSWGIGTGFRDKMSFQHFHGNLGMGVAYFVMEERAEMGDEFFGAITFAGLLCLVPEKVQRDFSLNDNLVIQPFLRVTGGHITRTARRAPEYLYWNPGFGWNLYTNIKDSNHSFGLSTEYQFLMGGSGLFFGANLNFKLR